MAFLPSSTNDNVYKFITLTSVAVIGFCVYEMGNCAYQASTKRLSEDWKKEIVIRKQERNLRLALAVSPNDTEETKQQRAVYITKISELDEEEAKLMAASFDNVVKVNGSKVTPLLIALTASSVVGFVAISMWIRAVQRPQDLILAAESKKDRRAE